MILKKECYNDERAIKKGNSLMLKKVIEEAFPTVLAFTMSGMYSIADGIFVGKAAGDTGLAAINIAWPIPALITALGIGIGTGGSVLYSHYRGRGEQKVCENLFELTMTLLIGTGILATILLSLVQKPFLEILGAAGSVQTEAIKYTAIIIAGSILQVAGTGIMPLLRNMNQSLGAMLSMAAGFAVNILVNYYLMFRLNMGIRGAAFGTVTAQAVVVMAGCAILWKTGYRKWRPLWHRQYAADIFKIGITAFGTSLAPTAALIFTNLQCLRYGGNAAVACYAAISYIVFPVQYFLTGIGEGVQPLISFYHGAKKETEVRAVKKIAYTAEIILGITAAAVTICMIPYIGGWFGLSAESKQYFSSGMLISSFAFLLTGTAKLNVSCLNAVMQTKKAVFMTYIESLAVSPICLFLLPAVWNIRGIWLALPATAGIMTVIYGLIRKDRKNEE